MQGFFVFAMFEFPKTTCMKTKKVKKPSIALRTVPFKGLLTKHINNCTPKRRKVVLDEWYCGITNNTTRRIAEHRYNKGEIEHFYYVDAKTLTNARETELYFTEKGTFNYAVKGGAAKSSTFVYVFKMPKTGLNGTEPFNVENYLLGL